MKTFIALSLLLTATSTFAADGITCRIKFNFGSKRNQDPNGRLLGRMRTSIDAVSFQDCLNQIKGVAATPLKATVNGIVRFEFPESLDYTYDGSDVSAEGTYLDKKFTRVIESASETEQRNAAELVRRANR